MIVQPLVRDGDDADVGLDGGERVVRRQRPGRGEGVEDGALADVGQTDDSDFQCHRAGNYRRIATRTTPGPPPAFLTTSGG